MSITAGTRLGVHQVLSPLGAGGMGEVYRATDTRLGRDVALKVLPAALAADPDRLARFEREARLLASLNHPNIAHLYGFEPVQLDQGTAGHLLVMEFVAGEDLAARLERGAIPVEQTISIARQVAAALEEAHEKGIVHRDLKPANVKLTPEDQVKVLDFGLAKAWRDDAGATSGSAPAPSQSPTLAHTGTAAGLILGTAAYMSPEQARGRAVDKRSDIWAFGVVLYEMLTGRRLFEGETVSDVLAAVLTREPDWPALPPTTPAALRELLRRCLQRDPKNRLHDIADARIALDELRGGGLPAPTEPPRKRGFRPAALAALIVVLLLGGAAGWALRRPRAATPPVSRCLLAIPDGLLLSTTEYPQLALSRDGRLQASVVSDERGVERLLIRRGDEVEPRVLPDTDGATSPFFSPDGAWIAFFRQGAIWKLPIAGGPPVRIAETTAHTRGGTWSSDGFIYFAPDTAVGLSRVSESGGGVQPVTRLDEARDERTHRWPEALPDGSAVLFTDDTAASVEYYDDARIEAVRPATGARKVLVEGASMARYSPSGHLVFARGGSLFAVPFDAGKLEVHGSPAQVQQGVATDVGSGAVQVAVSPSGVAVWTPGGLQASYELVWIDRKGVETPIRLFHEPYQEAALSPDGKRVALVGGQVGASDLWVADLERESVTRLTFGETVASPVWSPDASRLAYATRQTSGGSRSQIAWRPADGSQAAEVLLATERIHSPSSFSPDGRWLLFDGVGAKGEHDVGMLPVTAPRTARVLVEGPFAKSHAVVSPDGRWLAYVSDEGGQSGVYVRPFPAGPGRWQISTPEGTEPRWSPDGREILYRSVDVLYGVAIDTRAGFRAGTPRRLFDRVATGARVYTYSPSPDGRRILTSRSPEKKGTSRAVALDLDFARRLGPAGHHLLEVDR